MAEYGGVNPVTGRRPSTVRSNGGLHPEQPLTLNLSESTTRNSADMRTLDEVMSPAGQVTPNPWGTRPGSLDIDDYFVGLILCGVLGFSGSSGWCRRELDGESDEGRAKLTRG